LRDISTVVVAPICEEIAKAIAVRVILFRGICCDARAVMTYTFIPAVIFVAFENFLAWQNQFKDNKGWYIRYWPGLMHLVCSAIVGSRLARWRFQGRYRSFVAIIWPAVLVHMCNNFCAQLLSRWLANTAFWAVYTVYLVAITVLARYHFMKVQKIPVVDVQKLIATGQIHPRSIQDMLEDYAPPFNVRAKYRGIFMCLMCCSKRRNADRVAPPTEYGEVKPSAVFHKGVAPEGAVLIQDESKRKCLQNRVLKTKIDIYPLDEPTLPYDSVYRKYTLKDRFLSLFRHRSLRAAVADFKSKKKSSTRTQLNLGSSSDDQMEEDSHGIWAHVAQRRKSSKKSPFKKIKKSYSRATTRADSMLSRSQTQPLSPSEGHTSSSRDVSLGNAVSRFGDRIRHCHEESTNSDEL
jgi:hypothetical protein